MESQDKDIIELEVTQFLCDVIPKKSGYYSRTSLKNALSAISRHLQNVKPGLLKDMKKKGIGETKSIDELSTDEIQSIINHEALNSNTPLGLLKQVFFWICILGAPKGGEHTNLLASQLVNTPEGIFFKKE
ncbi:unnamed protein product [Rhizophagus irregularis]|nr:unnamed protein product [Rhizophagus irregularis]